MITLTRSQARACVAMAAQQRSAGAGVAAAQGQTSEAHQASIRRLSPTEPLWRLAIITGAAVSGWVPTVLVAGSAQIACCASTASPASATAAILPTSASRLNHGADVATAAVDRNPRTVGSHRRIPRMPASQITKANVNSKVLAF